MRKMIFPAVLATSLCVVLADTTQVRAQQQPFGTAEDVAFAQELWDTLSKNQLAGSEAIVARPYPGTEPHGAILITLERGLAVGGGPSAPVIVKNNYMAEGLTAEKVYNRPDQDLAAVTVMYRRPGYAPDSGDWYWVKYGAGGRIDKAEDGTPLAGRVAGCIECHADAPGKDYVFNHDRFSR